jgi:hypothetical protein
MVRSVKKRVVSMISGYFNTTFYTYYSDCCGEVVNDQDTRPYCSDCGSDCRSLSQEEYEKEQEEKKEEQKRMQADRLYDEHKEGFI